LADILVLYTSCLHPVEQVDFNTDNQCIKFLKSVEMCMNNGGRQAIH